MPIQYKKHMYIQIYYNPPVENRWASGHGPQSNSETINYFTGKFQHIIWRSLKMTAGRDGFISLFTEVNYLNQAQAKSQLFNTKEDRFRANMDFSTTKIAQLNNFCLP